MNLAERLRIFREQCGFSQQQIADKLNIHRATYSYYELGRTEPSVDNLIRLARIFNITVSELLGVEDSSSQSKMSLADHNISIIRPEDEERLDRLVGTTKVGDLTTEEKRLIISYRTLTAEQRRDLIETMLLMGLKSEKQ